MGSSNDSIRRVRFSTAIALGSLALACVGAHAANLDEVTVTVHGAKIGQAEFPWSRHIGFDPSTSVIIINIGKGCYFSFVLTAFSAGCVSDAARGDLFNPKYRVPALELPAQALPGPGQHDAYDAEPSSAAK